MKLVVGTVVGLLATTWAFPQQVGVVNIPPPELVQPAPQQKPEPLPKGCTQPTGVMAYGAVKQPDGEGPAISLEVVKLSSPVLEVGGVGQAEIELKNVGNTSINIPWSTDSGIMQKAPNPDVLRWDQANLDIVLLDKNNHRIALKTADWPLVGTAFVTDSFLKIRPGEWLTVFLGFRVETPFHTLSSSEFPVGELSLFVEWEQASRSWSRQKCGWSRAWFAYPANYYKQEHPTIKVQINRSASVAGEPIK